MTTKDHYKSTNKGTLGQLEAFLQDLKSTFSPEQIITTGAREYEQNTINAKRRVPLALKPKTTEQVSLAVKLANRHMVKLYPVSTGKNWGYGTASPTTSGSVVIDLSEMNKIIEMNFALNWIRLQPGVTQGQLYKHFEETNLNYMVPTTGAGTQASVVGNLLERGYGITPIADHFQALLAIEAVLPNGEIYHSPLLDIMGENGRAFKWGLGPYLDGIFSQSNLAIVTEATVLLAPKPEKIESFFFACNDPNKISDLVEAVRLIRQQLGSAVGGINLMNDRRTISMTADYPEENRESQKMMSDEQVAALCKTHNLGAWSGVGTLYGPAPVVNAARKIVKKHLRPHTDRLAFLTIKKARILQALGRWLTHFGYHNLERFADRLYKGIELMNGIPNNMAHALVYWKLPKTKRDKFNFDSPQPEKDGCGLMWYAPLVPKNPSLVKAFENMVDLVCKKHGIEPLITFTSISEQCFDCTVPILFDKANADEFNSAKACYQELLREGHSLGVYPYRLSIEQMKKVSSLPMSFWSTAEKIKKALDPNNIVAPGRYSR